VVTIRILGVFRTLAIVRLHDPKTKGFAAIFLRQGAGSDTVIGKETWVSITGSSG
jgi:hypothetical protein